MTHCLRSLDIKVCCLTSSQLCTWRNSEGVCLEHTTVLLSVGSNKPMDWSDSQEPHSVLDRRIQQRRGRLVLQLHVVRYFASSNNLSVKRVPHGSANNILIRIYSSELILWLVSYWNRTVWYWFNQTRSSTGVYIWVYRERLWGLHREFSPSKLKRWDAARPTFPIKKWSTIGRKVKTRRQRPGIVAVSRTEKCATTQVSTHVNPSKYSCKPK